MAQTNTSIYPSPDFENRPQVDSAATKELATEVEAVRNDNRVQKVGSFLSSRFKFSTSTYLSKVAGVVFTVGGLASGAKGLMDVVKGATPGQVFQNTGGNSHTFHFSDNYCWP